MIINLNKTMRLSSDEKNIILEEKKTVKTGDHEGEETWVFVGAYPSFEWAIASILKKKIQTSEVEGIQNIIKEIKNGVQTLYEEIRVLHGDIKQI